MGRPHRSRPDDARFLLGVGALAAGLFLVAAGLATETEATVWPGPFALGAEAPSVDLNEEPVQQTRSFGLVALAKSNADSGRAGSPSLTQPPPLMRPVDPYSGGDPARPDRDTDASTEAHDHRTVILRMSAAAHRRAFVELPTYCMIRGPVGPCGSDPPEVPQVPQVPQVRHAPTGPLNQHYVLSPREARLLDETLIAHLRDANGA